MTYDLEVILKYCGGSSYDILALILDCPWSWSWSLRCLPFSPGGLVTRPGLFSSTPPFALLASLNFTSFFFSFFAPSWLPLGLPFGAFLAPKLAQVRPKLPLDT